MPASSGRSPTPAVPSPPPLGRRYPITGLQYLKSRIAFMPSRMSGHLYLPAISSFPRSPQPSSVDGVPHKGLPPKPPQHWPALNSRHVAHRHAIGGRGSSVPCQAHVECGLPEGEQRTVGAHDQPVLMVDGVGGRGSTEGRTVQLSAALNSRSRRPNAFSLCFCRCMLHGGGVV